MRSRAVLSLAAIAGGYATVYHLGRSWGATAQERQRTVPGDELVAGPKLQTTHAITIDAPPEAVWPWLVQMGWGRAGWYTYRWVDRLLFPANGPSAEAILPEYQQLQVGDHVPDGAPETNCYFTVRALEPARLLVLFSDSHLFGPMAERDDVTMAWAWTWQLTPIEGDRTRLLQRNNGRLTPAWAAALYLATIVPADFLMARSHLRGIAQRAEATASVPVPVWAADDRHGRSGPSCCAARSRVSRMHGHRRRGRTGVVDQLTGHGPTGSEAA